MKILKLDEKKEKKLHIWEKEFFILSKLLIYININHNKDEEVMEVEDEIIEYKDYNGLDKERLF